MDRNLKDEIIMTNRANNKVIVIKIITKDNIMNVVSTYATHIGWA